MKNRWLSFPYIVWMAVFTIIPVLLVLYYALSTNDNGVLRLTVSNFAAIFTNTNLYVMGFSIKIAAISTIICFILGYPVAYIMASKEYSQKTVLLFLFVVPMWMNALLRTYAWLTLLESNGAINSALGFLSDTINSLTGSSLDFKIRILYTDAAVYLGMVYNFIPFMILPVYTVLTKMDYAYIEAAQDLGANPVRVFWRVVFPLSIPGVISGITMVFMPAVTTFVISTLLGGGQYIMIGNQIEKQFITLNNWHFGSALSIMLMVIILLSMSIFSVFDKNKAQEEEGGRALF